MRIQQSSMHGLQLFYEFQLTSMNGQHCFKHYQTAYVYQSSVQSEPNAMAIEQIFGQT